MELIHNRQNYFILIFIFIALYSIRDMLLLYYYIECQPHHQPSVLFLFSTLYFLVHSFVIIG